MADWPVREKSLNGEPKPLTSIERTCRTCGASFILTAPGKTHERGIWRDWCWYCSWECVPVERDPVSVPGQNDAAGPLHEPLPGAGGRADLSPGGDDPEETEEELAERMAELQAWEAAEALDDPG